MAKMNKTVQVNNLKKVPFIFLLLHHLPTKNQLKASQFQKDFLVSSFGPKKQRHFFRISALASKKSSNQKTLIYNNVKKTLMLRLI